MNFGRLKTILASREFKFLLVGGTNTAASYGLYVILRLLLSNAITDQTCLLMAYVPAMILGYVLQRRFVWKSKNRFRKEAPRYFLIVVIQFAVNSMILWVLVALAHLNAILAQTIATVILVVISFIVHGKWTFKADGPRD